MTEFRPALRRASLAVLVALFACGSDRDGSLRVDSSAVSGAVAPVSADEPSWFRQARALDLTADGTLDSVTVEARGTRSDSLRLRLTFVVDGRPLFVQEWDAEYQLAMADSAQRHPPGSDREMRTALSRILADVRLSPLDTSFIADFPGDTLALAMARRGPVPSIRVSYGYETTVVVVWDPVAGRFLVAHACC